MTIPKEALEAAARTYDPEAWAVRDRLEKRGDVDLEELDNMVERSIRKAKDILTAALPHLREQIISDLIGPEASLTASVRAFKTGWHQADMEGRVGERTADGLRNVVNARIVRGEQ